MAVQGGLAFGRDSGARELVRQLIDQVLRELQATIESLQQRVHPLCTHMNGRFVVDDSFLGFRRGRAHGGDGAYKGANLAKLRCLLSLLPKKPVSAHAILPMPLLRMIT